MIFSLKQESQLDGLDGNDQTLFSTALFFFFFPPNPATMQVRIYEDFEAFFSILDCRNVQQKHLTRQSWRLEDSAILGGGGVGDGRGGAYFVSRTELLMM